MKKSTKLMVALLVIVAALAVTYRPVSYTHLTLPTKLEV